MSSEVRLVCHDHQSVMRSSQIMVYGTIDEDGTIRFRAWAGIFLLSSKWQPRPSNGCMPRGLRLRLGAVCFRDFRPQNFEKPRQVDYP